VFLRHQHRHNDVRHESTFVHHAKKSQFLSSSNPNSHQANPNGHQAPPRNAKTVGGVKVPSGSSNGEASPSWGSVSLKESVGTSSLFRRLVKGTYCSLHSPLSAYPSISILIYLCLYAYRCLYAYIICLSYPSMSRCLHFSTVLSDSFSSLTIPALTLSLGFLFHTAIGIGRSSDTPSSVR